ncbi:MAG: hypothetical protein PHQ86_07790 [Dehalococcoidales bacterium]|nr:hypothetical protein [Dehalococcoidales bacterium]
MKGYGPIFGVGAIGVLLIYMGASNLFGLSPEMARGLIFIGISLLLFLFGGAAFSFHWIAGVVVLVIGVIVFLYGLNLAGCANNTNQQSLLPVARDILLF